MAAPASGTGPGTVLETCSTVNWENTIELGLVPLDVRDVTTGTPAAAVNWLLNGVRIPSGNDVWVDVLEF
jgi:hypothetical protein